MQVLPAKRREGYYTEKYQRGLRNRNREHLVNLCEISPRKTPKSKLSQLARALFPVESNKNENNTPKSRRRQMYLRMNINYECSIKRSINFFIQSVFCQVLKAVSDGLLKRKRLIQI